MISDQERREVAAKLRGLDERIDGVALMCTKLEHDAMALRAIRAVVGKGDIFHLLADFIDRPTCDVRMGVTGRIGVCTRCGAMVEMRAAVFDALEALPTRYCPNCGAEVIPHAERRD